MPEPCNVTKGNRCKDAGMSMGILTLVGALIVVSGIIMVLLSVFLPVTLEQAAVLNSLGIPVFIFGLVMFGILLANYAKKLK